jgi:hypothetical protein
MERTGEPVAQGRSNPPWLAVGLPVGGQERDDRRPEPKFSGG